MAFQTNFKHEGPSASVQRRLRRQARVAVEDAADTRVRRRDRSCRFPQCGCRRLGLRLEVSHQRHRGMGGNPKGDRSNDALLMLLCHERHQAHAFSLHQGTVAWEPLTRYGANGPVRWLVDVRLLAYHQGHGVRPARARLVEVARETAVGVVEIPERWREVVATLASMRL